MSVYTSPTFYFSIFSSVCFLASEILPFIPMEGNGILHTIVEFLSSFNKPANNKETNKPGAIEDVTKPLVDTGDKPFTIEDANKQKHNEKLNDLITKLDMVLDHLEKGQIKN